MARLRLGWIHLLLRDKRAAGDLSTVLQDATEDSIRYLAHLFLGAVAEQEGRLGALDPRTLDRLPLNVTLVLDVSQSLSGARLAPWCWPVRN
jgi:hypothetical protein